LSTQSAVRSAVLAAALWSVSPAEAAPAPLGVTYGGWRGGFADAEKRLATFKELGFAMVSFVPAFSYVGRNKVDVESGPSFDALGAAVEAALRAGFQVVIKPHLNPSAYQPGYDSFQSENHSWRAQCPWRGYFDLDPTTASYKDGVIFSSLRMLQAVFQRFPGATPVRLELGVELMNSIVEFPERWERLLADARKETRRLGLGGKVLLSHNFSHHLGIPDDQIDRMSPAGRRALARYIKGLDALALSQYMDLTAAMPAAERGRRLPTADEVAQALVAHEKALRKDILQGALGLGARDIPPLHIGEFGVGRGGLKHPNLWSGPATPEQEKALAKEIARGQEGLFRYLALAEGRTAQSAVLWVTGTHYDIFGWGNPAHAIPEAAAVIRAGLAAQRSTPSR
jgi:hypothetical protein